MNAFFQELGRSVLSQWKAQNFSLDIFPELARAAIEAKLPSENVDLAALMREFLLDDAQAAQSDSPFGEPEIIVFHHSRFYIQLLFWMDGTTDIHQHEFSGAFHVMHGSSIHAHYDFDDAKAITPYLRTGKLKLRDMELLETGRTVPIASGRDTIHSLFHLDSPSVTVVVRTQHDPGTGPQLNYLPPHVAFDPHFSDKLTLRRKQLLDVLERSGDIGYVPLVMEMLAELDFERGFSILHYTADALRNLEEWDTALAAFEQKHGPLASGIAATLKEDSRRNYLRGLRSHITDPEHRFFLALLMNAPTRETLLALVAQRYPDEKPADVVLRWAGDLVELSEDGVALFDAVFPETIEAEYDQQAEMLLLAFGHFLTRGKKLSAELKELSPSDIKSLRAAFDGSALAMLIG